MSSARKHLRNLAFNWGGHASTLLVMFFLSPYIVGRLNLVNYGILNDSIKHGLFGDKWSW